MFIANSNLNSLLFTTTFVSLGALSVYVNDWFTQGVFGQNLFLLSALLFVVYWTISIFIFLFNRSLYASYTTVIQRYWKRALYLFWGLELFLFSIFLYLVLVAPTEVEWLLDQSQLFNTSYWSGPEFITRLLLLLSLIICVYLMQFMLINLSLTLFQIASVVTTVLLAAVLAEDFFQTYFYSLYYSGMAWVYDADYGAWSLTYEMDKCRTITHYMFLVIILKFWHTLFIGAFWLVTTMFSLQSPQFSQGALASNKQNFFFLFGFGLIFSYGLYKSYISVSYEYVYAWFFVNNFVTPQNSLFCLCEPLLSVVAL